MKKRFLSLFLILIFLIGTVSAAVPYKESLTIYNYKINEVQCSNNSLRVLVESKASANLNLMFKITSKTTNSIFSNQELKRFETNWFLITTNKACKDLKKIEINGYVNVDNQNIVYLNSESSYLFTGTESPITQAATTTEILPSIQQTTTITSTSNIYFGYKLIETIDSNNEVKYFHQDHLGSNRIITNANGALVSRLDYEPFGKDLSYNNAKYKFTGKEKDSSSLYYFGARYYDPSVGRFTSVDPSFEPSETPYSYVDNNPLNKVDPDGRFAWLAPLLGAAGSAVSYGQAIMQDPLNMIDVADLRQGWNNNDAWTVGFAVLGLASAGSSGRGFREGAENIISGVGGKVLSEAKREALKKATAASLKTHARPSEKQLRKLYEGEGKSLSDIADIYNTYQGTTWKWMKAAGITLRNQRSTHKVTVEELNDLLGEGLSYREIAKRLGVGSETVRENAIKAGLTELNPRTSGVISPLAENLLDRIAEGKKPNEIAKEFGVTRAKVIYWRNKLVEKKE